MSNAGLFYAITLFFLLTVSIIGVIGNDYSNININTNEYDSSENPLDLPSWVWNIALNTGFIGDIIIGISILPLWLNTLIFVPIIAVFTFLIISVLWSGS